MKFKPKHNHVIIEPKDFKENKIGNILVPDNGNEVPRTGIVIAVGVGTFTIGGECLPMQCEIGDKVYYPAFGGQKISIDGVDYIAMKDTDVITAFENDKV